MELPSSQAPVLINRHITSVRNFFLCQYAFKTSSIVDKRLVSEIIEVVSGKKIHLLSRDDFRVLHEAVAAKVCPYGQASWVTAAKLLSWKPDEDFMKVDYNYNGDVDAAEVLVWMKQIAHVHKPWNESLTQCLQDVLVRCQAKVEVQKYELAREWMETMEQYDDAYLEFLQSSRNKDAWQEAYKELVLCKTSADLSKPYQSELQTHEVIEIKNEGETQPRQPLHLKTFDELYQHGQDILDLVAAFAESLRHSVQAPFFSMAAMKGVTRAKEKIDLDYGGDVSRLMDLVRFSIMCKNLAMAQQVIDLVRSHEKWEVVRVKSGFDPNSRLATIGGYRDVKINARCKENGHIIEIQLNVAMFYLIKQESGHKIYEWSRKFDVQGITSAEDVLNELTPRLLKEMAQVAKENLEKSVRSSGMWSKISLHKRMTVFECLRLSGLSQNELAEHADILLNAVGEGEDIANAIHCGDRLFHRDVVLLVGRAYDCKLPAGVTNRSLLEKALHQVVKHRQKVPKEQRFITGSLFLAQCKAALANAVWAGTGCDREVIQYFQDVVDIYIECGLAQRHPAVIKAKKNLGSALVCRDELQAGINCLLEAQAAMKTLYSFRNHRTAAVLVELGIAFRKSSARQGGVNELRLKALWYLVKGLAGRRACFGEEDELVGNVYFEMALLKADHADFHGAVQDLHSCVSIWTKAGA
eukprot:gnl/MRDRNA2_/MRDRNA2_162207_c0_seq1.p1 gnl/MRDRNA2_/MRDRNA2_162207_c0~~gnl/MRDRNA2_/MRDRNA2_162207_c0_seq1.p1  ORF type:complete len:816 (+),score=176.27 gnl/MRDRNA2_/MRDRNA2_162207_c0_seq1:361-2448(+)